MSVQDKHNEKGQDVCNFMHDDNTKGIESCEQ